MKAAWLLTSIPLVLAGAFTAWPAAQSTQTAPSKAAPDGPFARIAVLRPHDGDTIDFEAGYIRHLEFHRHANDAWSWYGWTIWAGDRQRWFVYGTFGHSVASLDHSVPAGDDERDNISNVTPHAEFVGSALYEFLPSLSRGTAVPTPAARLELTTVDLDPGAGPSFESAVRIGQAALREETLWFRLIAGGPSLRYLRFRSRPNLSVLLEEGSAGPLAEGVASLTRRITVEILNFRPTMSYHVEEK
jgi:hypothetical protein